jgi:hypothetical protein
MKMIVASEDEREFWLLLLSLFEVMDRYDGKARSQAAPVGQRKPRKPRLKLVYSSWRAESP